jgi:hypothetical protein
MNAPLTLAEVVYSLLIALPVTLFVGALVLRAACWMVGVAVPPLFYAMGMVLLTAFAMALVTVMVRLGIGFAGAGGGMNERQLQLGAGLLGLPLHVLAAAAIYAGMLKVGVGKAILIRLAELVLLLILGIVVAALVLLVRGSLR